MWNNPTILQVEPLLPTLKLSFLNCYTSALYPTCENLVPYSAVLDNFPVKIFFVSHVLFPYPYNMDLVITLPSNAINCFINETIDT